MMRPWTLTFLFALAGTLASDAGAIVNPCSGFNSNLGPHPWTGSPTIFLASFSAIPPLAPIAPNETVVSRTSTGAGRSILLDLILTNDVSALPEYQVTSVSTQAPSVIQVSGPVGLLDPGTYTLSTTWRRYSSGVGFVPFESCGPTIQSQASVQVFATSGLSPVVEFYCSALDHYFVTIDPIEIQALDTAQIPGWTRTGQAFPAYLPGQTGGMLAMASRFYGRPEYGLNSHFFTIDIAELVALLIGPLEQAWEVETRDAFELYAPSNATGACPAGTIPVYRLWNGRSDSNHRYTTSQSVRQQMIDRGYISEGYGPDGTVMCAPQ